MRTFAVELGHHFIRVNSIASDQREHLLFANEGTMKLFRPDLENPAPMTWRRWLR